MRTLTLITERIRRKTRATMSTFLYFGYGSNLLKERIQLKNPSAVCVDAAQLKDYKLCFSELKDGISGRWKGCVASIEQRPQQSVWGVVWRLNEKDLSNLDSQEEEGHIYRRIRVTVQTGGGESMSCWTYTLINFKEGLPSPQYMQVIREGAIQNGLPEKYREWLASIPDNGYSGDVNIMNRISASKDEETFLYFAYASNLLEARIHLQNPTAQIVGPAKLEGYKLHFGGHDGYTGPQGSLWRGAKAFINETPGTHVWGAIWKIHKSQVDNLDRQEEEYDAIYVNVTTPEGMQHKCRTFKLRHPSEEGDLPSPHYMKVIIEGATAVGIPKAYIDELKDVPHNHDTEPPPFLHDLLKKPSSVPSVV